jgi:hypothetical protein
MPLGAMSWDCQAVGREKTKQKVEIVRSYIGEGCDEIEESCF